MIAELLAIGCLVAWPILGVFFYRREKKEVLDKVTEMFYQEKAEIVGAFNIEQLKLEFTEIVDERLQAAIDAIGESFGQILSEPTVKKAFSIIGSQGGEAKAANQVVDDMAKDMIDGPQFAAIKLGAEALGIDVGSYIEKHGAMNTLRAAQQLGQFAGIDIMNLNLGSLALPGASGPSRNPYIRR